MAAGAAWFNVASAETPPVQTIAVAQGRLMASQGALLIDVREPDEYAEGHAPGSVLIPLGQLPGRLAELRASQDKPVALICRSGRRSARAAEILRQAGFSKVYNIEGGMNAWSAAGLPVLKGAK
ncbi:MAG: rhodanese-like domain-containing protein [Burkholderiaceae bacterium]|nr:rhodanese-like domain-containing protein [Burkholderiaceae bacterium]